MVGHCILDFHQLSLRTEHKSTIFLLKLQHTQGARGIKKLMQSTCQDKTYVAIPKRFIFVHIKELSNYILLHQRLQFSMCYKPITITKGEYYCTHIYNVSIP